MKRSQIVFVVVVFLAVLAGFLTEWTRRADPFEEHDFTPPKDIQFEPLVAPMGTLELRGVVRTSDGEPREGVQVTLLRPRLAPGETEPLPWTVTDDDGRFELAGLADGEYDVVLLCPEVPNTEFAFSLPVAGEVDWSLSAPLAALPALPDIERAPLSGRVLPPLGLSVDDYPVEDYEVVLTPTDAPTAITGAVIRTATSDATGAFYVEDLIVSSYTVAILPPWARGGTWPVLDEAPLVHTSAPNGAPPLTLRLRCGEITGRLNDLEDLPVEGALVKVWALDADGAVDERRLWPTVASDARGTFLVRDLPSGAYRLHVRAGKFNEELDVRVIDGVRSQVAFGLLDPTGDEDDG